MPDVNSSSERPSPDFLLEEARREQRGRLKVFLGASPGVGKTYDMLRAAQAARHAGIDVVVGIVETHGRVETQALLGGLEVLPRRTLDYRGHSLDELDVDTLIARRPQLALIDELAHTNAPGSRHVKRWQDVDDVLAAGIDVLATLNVQHLESLNDVVARITGIRVRETLPDTVLEKADEIELIDLPPDELIQRLEQGKIYSSEQANRAKEGFFQRGTLTALRELALRAAAERVDQQMLAHMRRHAVRGIWPARDRLLVCVDGEVAGKALIRAAARLADTRGIAWIAVHVIDSRASRQPDAVKDRIAETLRLAESLGGEATTIPGENVGAEILAYARSRNVTQIVLGRPRRRRWPWRLRPSPVGSLLRLARDLEVTLVPDIDEARLQQQRADRPAGVTPLPRTGYWLALAAATVTTAIGLLLDRWLGPANLATLYLLAVLVCSVHSGAGPGIAASFVGALCFNFFFTEPLYTLTIHQHQDLITLAVFLVVSVLMGRLGSQLRAQMSALRKTARRNANLNEFVRRVAGALSRDDVLNAIAEHVRTTLDAPCIALVEAPLEQLRPSVRCGISPDYQFQESDRAAAQWAWEHRQIAGFRTQTLPSSRWLFVPLETATRVIGLIGLSLRERRRPLSAGQSRLLDAIADQAAVALERMALAAEIEDRRVATEAEQLRAALLSSVSHDLRTPLASILGAATSLQTQGEKLPAESRVELLDAIVEESERLNRFVQNLLDMTRLGYGKLSPKYEWCDLSELIGRATKRLSRRLGSTTIAVRVAADFPVALVDPLLMEQALFNVLDNASQYAPPGSSIEIKLAALDTQLVIEVRDHGPGIPAEHREQVFDMFYRVQSQDHTRPGTGLGLAISRGLLQAQGGSVRALAPPDNGKGALIQMTLPRGKPPRTDP